MLEFQAYFAGHEQREFEKSLRPEGESLRLLSLEDWNGELGVKTHYEEEIALPYSFSHFREESAKKLLL